jgi:hypothetical protein
MDLSIPTNRHPGESGKVTGTRGGPFFRFLELLRKPVLKRALKAGSSLSLEPLSGWHWQVTANRVERYHAA